MGLGKAMIMTQRLTILRYRINVNYGAFILASFKKAAIKLFELSR